MLPLSIVRRLAVEAAASVEDAVDSATLSPAEPLVAVALGRTPELFPIDVVLDCLLELPLVVDEIPIVVDFPSSTTKTPEPEGNAEYTTPETVTASPPADGKAVPPMMYGESPLPEPEIPCSMYWANSSEPSTTTPSPEGRAEYTTPETVVAAPPAMTVMLPSKT